MIRVKKIVYAIIYPNIVYCLRVWSGTYKTSTNAVVIGQKGNFRAIHEIRQSHNGGNVSINRFTRIEIMKYVAVAYVFRSMNNKDLDEFSFENYNRNIRHSNLSLLGFRSAVKTWCTIPWCHFN